MRPTIAACLIAALAAPSAFAARPTPQQQLDKLLEGRTAGPPQSCIPLRGNERSTVIPKIGIVYDIGRTRYVQRFQQGCPELDEFRTIVTQSPQNQRCRGDIGQIMNRIPAFPVGACVFDNFTPYIRPR